MIYELYGAHVQVHELKFEFPFYGHTITSLAVTTGGMYTHTYTHTPVYIFIESGSQMIVG